MDDFSDLLSTETVSAALSAGTKKALLQLLAAQAARAAGTDTKLVIERLAEREKISSTGFGAGVAIPHAKIDGLPRVVGLFARLERPIDFIAIDGIAVDIVFALLSPSGAGVEHLKALARVSRRLRDRDFVAKLRGAASEDALWALLTSSDSRDSA